MFINSVFPPLIMATVSSVIMVIMNVIKTYKKSEDLLCLLEEGEEEEEEEEVEENQNPDESEDEQEDEQLVACPDLPNPNWIRIGYVTKLHTYPLTSGAAHSYNECQLTRHGMKTYENGRALLDGMFLVFNKETNTFQSYWNHGPLVVTKVKGNEISIKLLTGGMPDLTINMNEEIMKTREIIYFPTWHNNSMMKCIDCGIDAANWLNTYLRTTNLRLLLKDYDSIIDQVDINRDNWARFNTTYATVTEENLSPFPNLPRYVLTTVQTIEGLHQTLSETESIYEGLRYRPNIVVSTFPPFPAFGEKHWEWIRVGKTIIRNVKRVPRFFVNDILNPVIYCDENTHLGIYCGLYVPGNVTVGDAVFVHFPPKEPHKEKLLEPIPGLQQVEGPHTLRQH